MIVTPTGHNGWRPCLRGRAVLFKINLCAKSQTTNIQNGKDPRGILLACTAHVYRDPPLGLIAVKGLKLFFVFESTFIFSSVYPTETSKLSKNNRDLNRISLERNSLEEKCDVKFTTEPAQNPFESDWWWNLNQQQKQKLLSYHVYEPLTITFSWFFFCDSGGFCHEFIKV